MAKAQKLDASHLRITLEESEAELLAKPGVEAVGVAWRGDSLRFIVQASSLQDAERLKSDLPEAIGGLHTFVEAAPLSRAADSREVR